MIEYSRETVGYGLSSEQFAAEVKRRLGEGATSGVGMTLISLDFDNFNYVNDLYGYEIGDRVLERVGWHIDSVLAGDDIFCRLHADYFQICLATNDTARAARIFTRATDLKQVLAELLPQHYTLAASGGILAVGDSTIPLPALLDQANCARKLSKGSAASDFHIYDKKMDEDARWKKQVTCMMEAALSNREFEMYLQPKVLLKTGEIVGAEALVRWNTQEYGMICPDRFIPILEQNGFIRWLDFFMLEEACHFLDENRRSGRPILPISVNFSKTDLGMSNLVDRIFEIVNRHGIHTHLIEIEFTESALSENTERLIEVVSDLKLLGFRVSIDDFGSAYSSLSYLKDLPVDIVKVDKEFLNSSQDSDRGKIVIAKVVELIKSLRMLSVMEGVEEREQVEFLQKFGCDIGQGYYYARPMPKVDYLKYLEGGSLLADLEGYIRQVDPQQPDRTDLNGIPQEVQMDNWELYTLGKNIDMGLMKGYLDGEATAQYVNDRALEYLGYTHQEFREILHNSIAAFTHPEDVHIMQENTEQLVATGKPMKFETRAIRKDGKVIMLQGRSSSVIDARGRRVGIYAFQDVTEELERTAALQQALEHEIKELEETVASEQMSREALRQSEERYRIIVEQSDTIMFEWDFELDQLTFSPKYQALFGREPHGTSSATQNPDLRKYIHPEDIDAFEAWVEDIYRKPGCSDAVFRVADAQGRYQWMVQRTTAICNRNGVPIRAVGAAQNVQAQRELMEDLQQKVRLDPLTGLLNKTESQEKIDAYLHDSPGGHGVLFMVDVDNFKQINDNLGHRMGDTVLKEIAETVRRIFSETDMVGRIGGDEFAVYLPDVDERAVLEKAEKLTQFLHITYFGAVSKYEITGSIGLAKYPEHGGSFDALYRSADVALYEAKRKGKNCFVIYSDGIATQLLDNHTPVEHSDSFLSTYFQNDITFQVFGMLYETKDVSASIGMILELLGKRFGVDRVYIFESVEDGEYLRNTFEWCAPGVEAQIENLQALTMEAFAPYLEQYSPEGVFYCADIEKAIPAVYDVCAPQGIKSLLHCAIYDCGEQVGFIGFDSCREKHGWAGDEIAVLGYISRVLSVFLLKNDVSVQLKTSYRNYAGMVENLNGYVYVINAKTYEVLFVNRSMREELGLEPGKLCYDMAYGVDRQCAGCPIHQMNAKVHFATSEIYSEILQKWVHTAASKMTWEGSRDTVLVCCTDISKYK